MANIEIGIESVSFGYKNQQVLHDLDITFDAGELHAVIGPNGCGKTTLLNTISGNLQPSGGNISIGGNDLHSLPIPERAKLVSVVPQESSFTFPFTVFDAVLMGRHPYIPRFNTPTEEDLHAVHAALDCMDLSHLTHRTLDQLSGGERQRTVFARALAQDTPVLLLDEPTSSMDIRHALKAMRVLKRLARDKGRTVITVLHDLSMAARYCDRIAVMVNGLLHSQGTPRQTLTPATIQEVFGVKAHIAEHGPSDSLTVTYESGE